ncbi:hypothetical protein OQJ13_15160 [Legionella sp. PATHC035]|uniref:hypothetical protein n=1 Tax=Legionella sp. PATHC035 TaxID=2992040 RepID=UPI0022437712|nr:hypothetical protein [Legionella sp. PATHC035]MCW8410318.1 hypothetical protein [Legionella sp. PATHC035]
MSKLTKILKKIQTNLDNYLADPTQLDLLAENIGLFEEIPNSYLRKLYKKVSAFDLLDNNQALLTMASSYIHYAIAKKNNSQNLDNLLNLCNKASACFQRIINSTAILPPSLLTKEHSEHLLIANFQLHKIKFIQAEMRLFYILKNNLQSSSSVREDLTDIIAEYTHFNKVLAKRYKDRILREQLSIDSTLLDSIQEGLKSARNLLDSPPPQQTAKRYHVETDDSYADTEDLSNPKKKKDHTKDQSSASSSESRHFETENTSFDLSGLELLSTAATDIASMMVEEVHVQVSTMQQPNLAQEILLPQPILAQNTEGSQMFLTEFKKWADAYFYSRTEYSDGKRAEKSLAKIAHSLLFAAMNLQQESPVYKGKQFNPAIQMAVQLFLLASGKDAETALEATEKLRGLSKEYSILLRPFVRSFVHKPSPEKFILHLRMQFASENQSSVSFLGLELPDVIEKLFKHFETVLTVDDYERVTQCATDCLIKAYDRLAEQNSLPSPIRK